MYDDQTESVTDAEEGIVAGFDAGRRRGGISVRLFDRALTAEIGNDSFFSYLETMDRTYVFRIDGKSPKLEKYQWCSPV